MNERVIVQRATPKLPKNSEEHHTNETSTAHVPVHGPRTTSGCAHLAHFHVPSRTSPCAARRPGLHPTGGPALTLSTAPCAPRFKSCLLHLGCWRELCLRARGRACCLTSPECAVLLATLCRSSVGVATECRYAASLSASSPRSAVGQRADPTGRPGTGSLPSSGALPRR